jgi:hypothetical protein
MISETRYHVLRAHIGVPKRPQLPEHNGEDEDHLGHCGWGATVDTIGCSQVGTTEKNDIAPPNSRSPLGRTGCHERARKGNKKSIVPMLNTTRADSESLTPTAALIGRHVIRGRRIIDFDHQQQSSPPG